MNALRVAFLLPAVLAIVLAPTAPGQTTDRTPTIQAQAVLKKYCAACHGDNGTKKGGMNYILDHDQLIERGQVVPGEPGDAHCADLLNVSPRAKCRRPSTLGRLGKRS